MLTRKEIRLAHIRPLKHGEDVLCSLSHALLDDETRPKYGCLSYCREDLNDTEKITLELRVQFDGESKSTQSFKITKSLAQAIRSCRMKDGEPSASTKENVTERRHQVQCMKSIYANASPSIRMARRGA